MPWRSKCPTLIFRFWKKIWGITRPYKSEVFFICCVWKTDEDNSIPEVYFCPRSLNCLAIPTNHIEKPYRTDLKTTIRKNNWLTEYLINNLETILCSYSVKDMKAWLEIKTINMKELVWKLYSLLRTNWSKSMTLILWPVYDFIRSKKYPRTYLVFAHHFLWLEVRLSDRGLA